MLHLFPLMHIPARDLWWLAAGGAGYGARYIRLHWRSVAAPRRATAAATAPADDPTDELLRLQAAYGYCAHSLVSITAGARLWTSDGIDGAIIYSDFGGRVWLATGDPLAAEDKACELARRFIEAARQHGRVAAFVPVTARFARDATAHLGLAAVKVGAAPYFELSSWNPRGDRAKKLRAGVNQGRRAGVSVEAVPRVTNALRQEVAALCRRWLKTRRAATSFGWLFVLDPFQHHARKKFFEARDANGQLVGFLAASPMPARDGWYLEDVLREPDAPAGTVELLVVEALHELRAAGARLATLGTAPLASEGDEDVKRGAHPLIERTLPAIAARLGSFYNVGGLRRFKGKFVPTWWESEYVLVPPGATVPPRVAYAILRARVPGGIAQLLTRKLAFKLRAER